MSETVSQDAMQSLLVERAEEIAKGIHLFEFKHPDGADLPEFTPGAHLSVQTPNGFLRKYSLCSDPIEQDHYVIAIKREDPGGGGSIDLIENAKPGDRLLVSAPRNDFALAKGAKNFIFIAGGVGITPIMSMVRYLKRTGEGRFKLFYTSRTPEMTPFRNELSAPEFRGQVRIHHDHGDPAKFMDLWPILEMPKGEHVYCCGPRPLMESVRDMSGHWPPTAIHFEDFTKVAKTKPDDKPFRVRLANSDEVIDVPVGTSILEALRERGHPVPSSCESGTCGTCRTKLVAGEADHRDLVLAEHERHNNIMVCVSRALSLELVIEP
jgi:phthalate 4,5-dioxygenase reductase subunit